MQDRYGTDVLAKKTSKPNLSPDYPALAGTVVEDVTTGYVGAVKRCYKAGGMHVVELEDRHGKIRCFPLGAGFWIDGKPVTLVAPPPSSSKTQDANISLSGREISRSGSRKISVPQNRLAQVAKSHRIWVEGKHDSELIAWVWGEDLAQNGIVVEILDGVDNLPQVLAQFQPSPKQKAGVLLDHLVAGSKEYRLAQQLMKHYGEDSLAIKGHPFVDIWQAVKPQRLGLNAWPDIPRNIDIKIGSLRALGWPCETAIDVAEGWKKILNQVRDWRDLEPALLAPVEALIDFVTVDSI